MGGPLRCGGRHALLASLAVALARVTLATTPSPPPPSPPPVPPPPRPPPSPSPPPSPPAPPPGVRLVLFFTLARADVRALADDAGAGANFTSGVASYIGVSDTWARLVYTGNTQLRVAVFDLAANGVNVEARMRAPDLGALSAALGYAVLDAGVLYDSPRPPPPASPPPPPNTAPVSVDASVSDVPVDGSVAPWEVGVPIAVSVLLLCCGVGLLLYYARRTRRSRVQPDKGGAAQDAQEGPQADVWRAEDDEPTAQAAQADVWRAEDDEEEHAAADAEPPQPERAQPAPPEGRKRGGFGFFSALGRRGGGGSRAAAGRVVPTSTAAASAGPELARAHDDGAGEPERGGDEGGEGDEEAFVDDEIPMAAASLLRRPSQAHPPPES